MKNFKTKFTAEEIAVVSLDKDKTTIERDNNLHQVTLNIVTDKLRNYLGEHSKIYTSFSYIDISIQDGKRQYRINNAVKLLEAAISIIQSNGIYKDLPLKLVELQIKDMNKKVIYGIWGAIGGAILVNIKEIIEFLLSLLR
jgi:hypothetical protein